MEAHIVKGPGAAHRVLTVGAEAKTEAREIGGTTEPINFGATKAERLIVINQLLRESFEAGRASAAKAESGPVVHVQGASRDTAAERGLAAMDAPGVNIDALVEIIHNAKGYALGRLAKAVAVAFDGRAAA